MSQKSTNGWPLGQTKEKIMSELTELKLKKNITLNDKYRIQKLQQLLDNN